MVELFYNYKGERVVEKKGDKEIYYVYDNKNRVLSEINNKGEVLKEYIYKKEIPIGFIKDNKIYYYHYDLMNFPIMITDNTGKIVRKVQYKPYGEIISFKDELNDTLRFPGQYEIKGTNLSYNLNRIYTPVLTRYLEPDPIVNVNNIYEYAISNPIKYSDLEGKAEKFKYWNDMGPIKLIKGSVFIFLSVINFGGIYKSECSTNCPGKYNGYYARVVTADYVQARFECRLLGLKTKLTDFSWTDFIKWISKIPSGLSFEIEFESIDEIFDYPTKNEFKFNKGYVEIRINLKNKKFSAKVGNLKTNKMKCTSTFNIPSYADFIIKGKLLWAKGNYDCCAEKY